MNRFLLALTTSLVLPLAAQAAPRLALHRSTVGSGNTAVIEPMIPVPAETPCIVPLTKGVTFGASNATFNFVPPKACPGPWAKVVLAVDVSLNAGIQYDRTGTLWLGGVPLWFGTTSEPDPNLGPSWSFQKDVTEYSALFKTKQTGFELIANYTNSTDTSIITSSARLFFFPANAQYPAPVVPDVVVPLANAGGGTVGLNSGSDTAVINQALPTNIAKAALDVYLQGQSGDEFWYTCVPNSLAAQLQSCGGGTFREGEISIDGTPAGVAPVFPWIFTGGIDPFLWTPTPGVQTLNFKPFRVELSPFAGVLSNGQPHQIALSVNGANGYFSVAGAMFLWLDAGTKQVTGSVTTNTLGAPPTATVTTGINTNSAGVTSGPVNTTEARAFTISGTAVLSTGKVTYGVTQLNNFVNDQTFLINAATYQQQIQQTTTTSVTTTAETASGTSHAVTELTYPLTATITLQQLANGNYNQTTSISQLYQANKQTNGTSGFTSHAEQNSINTTDTLQFDPSFNFLGNTGAASKARLSITDSAAPCVLRTLTSVANVLTHLTTRCP